MIELFALVCLAGAPDVCAERLLPGSAPCAEARAADWVAARPDLVLRSARCAELAEVVTPAEVEEVAPGVFVHRGLHALPDAENAGDQANLGFVIGEEAVSVIDAGGSRPVAEALYAAIRARTDLPIGWLVLTHMHPDHVLGAGVFAEAGARVIGHERLATALANRAETYLDALAREAGRQVAIGAEIVLPDDTVAERREIDLGGRALALEAHPTAHTDNDLTAFDAATGTWFMGDLVFEGHAPSIDGSVLGWLDLMDALAARPAARIVPGHGQAALLWPEGAAPMRGYFEALVAETRAALDRGESLGEATRHLGAGLGEGWALFEAFNTRNATAVYRELEWE